MIRTVSAIIIALTVLSSSLFSEDKTIKVLDNVKMKNQMDSVAYAIGLNFGKQLGMDDIKFDLEVFINALNTGMNDMPAQLNEEDINKVMMAFQKDMMAKQQSLAEEKARKNKEEGAKFLAENKKKPGIKVAESGLQYLVILEGKGKKPADTSTVKVHYEGKLIDGTVFDSSIERNQPAEFPLNRVISGWTEGLQLMSEGSKYRFFIPSDLGYGDTGAPQGTIPPGATLIFEVELIEVVK